jgi:uncharacterized membrane protein YgcG
MTNFKPSPQGPFITGVNSSTGFASRPRGSVPRASNLLIGKRGTLRTCDGSQLLHAYSGAVQVNRGKCLCNFLFTPTGVPNYYLSISEAFDQSLGPPKNLSSTGGTGSGSSLGAGTYFYEVTAVDGVGGETSVSNEISVTITAGQNIPLAWNVVPNAAGYKVYRGATTHSEVLITNVQQVSPGTLSVTVTDTGFTAVGAVYNIAAAPNGAVEIFGGTFTEDQFTLTTSPPTFPNGTRFTIAGCSILNGNFTLTGQIGSTLISYSSNPARRPPLPPPVTGGGGTLTILLTPPISDTTQQTALYRMPLIVGTAAVLPVAYNYENIVALFPASSGGGSGAGGGGGSGASGGTGGGGSTGGGTVSGGIQGNTCSIPQIIEFTNQAVIALGNGYPVQVYSDDTGTLTNSALFYAISSISVDAFGVVTIVTAVPHGFSTSQAGGNIIILNVPNTAYNSSPVGSSAFVILSVPNNTTILVRNLNAIGQAGSSGGIIISTALPLISNFIPAYPIWSTATSYAVNTIVQPSPGNLHYYKAVQGGTSGASQPVFPTGTGQRVVDGSVIWQEAGLLNSAAPPPQAGAHIRVYAGSLWIFNTATSNTANGLDGPCSMRMSDVNNLNSWNPINQAFLDKDDGTEGMGLETFTVAAQGIPPTGSLVACKNYALYQIVGVFGSVNFSIQRAKTDLGLISPRTLLFVPGYGITRFTHLGYAVFDGVDDRVISEPIRQYLFPSNDIDVADITVLDSNWQAISWAAQTASPPMYCVAIPIGASGGQLTRLVAYDLIAKGWCIIDLPFAISTMSQFKTTTANPVTVFGGFLDGALQRWQAGDVLWYTGATGAGAPSAVAISVRTPTTVSKEPDEVLYCRESIVRGVNTNSTSPLTLAPRVDGVAQPGMNLALPASGDFTVIYPVMQRGTRFEADISGTGDIEIDAFTFGVQPRPAGVLTRIS